MPPTRSVAKPEQNLHESEKAHRPEFHLTCGLFVSFSVLSASVFCPKDPVHRGWMLCRVWAPQPASAHGCAFSLALVRVPARSRGADRSWTPLRAPAVQVSASPQARMQAALPVQFSASPLARMQAMLSVRFLASPLARVQAAFPAQAGGPEPTPKPAVHPERTAAAWARCCPLRVSALAASSFRLFPCGAAPT